MLRECVRLAREEQRLVVFLEPIALYPMRDLHEPTRTAAGCAAIPPRRADRPSARWACTGTGAIWPSSPMATAATCRSGGAELRAAGIDLRIVDLRWLAPLPEARCWRRCGVRRVLVVDECRRSGGLSEALMTLLAEAWPPRGPHAAEDSFIATGPAYAATMPSRDGIVGGAMPALAPPGVHGKRA
jgi:2-oxoisovalerate dehydrogenase E1 component